MLIEKNPFLMIKYSQFKMGIVNIFSKSDGSDCSRDKSKDKPYPHFLRKMVIITLWPKTAAKPLLGQLIDLYINSWIFLKTFEPPNPFSKSEIFGALKICIWVTHRIPKTHLTNPTYVQRIRVSWRIWELEDKGQSKFDSGIETMKATKFQC